jgi:beta-N-acetylhexosaminidase
MDNIGQLVMSGIKGIALEDDEAKFLESENIGGVILFAHNYESPAQLAELVNSIQKCRSEYPLFIAVDQEGGRVQRFKNGFTILPPMHKLSETGSPKICFELHQQIAAELKACGVNLNFGPVCDIWTNPNNKVIGDRAFGNNPDIVSNFISSVIRGYQTNGIIACAKHFPGHGDTTKDSHYDLPYVKTDMDTLMSREIVPFRKAVKSRVEMVMMGHLVVDAIDTEFPCSLSKKAHHFLREELKYTKVIVSDDMEMKAIENHFPTGQAAQMALLAGTDIIIYRSMEKARIAMEALKKAKSDKSIRIEEFTPKIQRVNDLKIAYLKDYQPTYIPNITKQMNLPLGQQILASMEQMLEQKKQLS